MGNCRVTKVVRKGHNPKIFMKCEGKPQTKNMSAEEIIKSVK